MISCDEAKALISAKLDGALDHTEEKELASHLESCPDCRAYDADLRTIHAALSGEPVKAPSGFAERTAALAALTPRPPKTSRPVWFRPLALAACCAVAAVGVWGFSLFHAGGNAGSNAAPSDAASTDSAADSRSVMESQMVTGNAGGSDADAALPESGEDGRAEPEEKCSPYAVSGSPPESSNSDSGGAAAYDLSPSPGAGVENAETDSAADMYMSEGEFAALLTASSEDAGPWLQEHIGDCPPGGIYELNPDDYENLRQFLSDHNISFTETTSSGVGCFVALD